MSRRAVLGTVAAAVLSACAPGPGDRAATASATRPAGLTLDAEGLQPNGTPLRIDFGRAEAGTLAAASRLLGARPISGETRWHCGRAPVVAWRWASGLTLLFRGGTFLGWSSEPGQGAPIATASGLAPGAEASALAGVRRLPPGQGAGLGVEGVFVRVENGRVAAIQAGLACPAA